MEHQDIADLILAGDVDAAKAIIAQRVAKRGISGHDQQTLQALLNNAQPEVAAEEAVAEVAEEEALADAEEPS